MANLKFCYSCKLDKLIIDFSKNKNKKDGLNDMCKFCSKIYHKNYRILNKENLFLKRRFIEIKTKKKLLKINKIMK